VIACGDCGNPLAPADPPPGSLTPVWAHALPTADGHEPGVPPVVVTYTVAGEWCDAECPEVPGFPVNGARGLAEAKSVAWVLLGRVMPPRPVVERVKDAASGPR
jgi:hypothetical protein